MSFNDLIVTLDIDWAPDFVIDFVAERLVACPVRATWFVTHASPAVERLRQHSDLFELGIHPNFLPGSTHGDTPEAVLRHCLGLVPNNATSVRTHGLVQSSPLLAQIMAQTPITTDVSLFLPHMPHLRPVEYRVNGRMLWRIPYFWEDDFEMERTTPCWHLAPLLTAGGGLKVFDFHPIHVYLNSAETRPYWTLKQRVPDLPAMTPADAAPFVNSGIGARTLFMELVEHLVASRQSICIRDVVRRWTEREPVEAQ